MKRDLKVFLVKKEDVERGNRSIEAVARLNMAKRRELFLKILEIPSKELSVPLWIGVNEQVEENRYGEKLYYVECSELSKVISEYEEKYKGSGDDTKLDQNALFGQLIQTMNKHCYAILYWY